jgi:hypothetical protein
MAVLEAGIRDCDCGLRYWQHHIKETIPQIGRFRCVCGQTLATWYGDYRLTFQAEDEPAAAFPDTFA